MEAAHEQPHLFFPQQWSQTSCSKRKKLWTVDRKVALCAVMLNTGAGVEAAGENHQDAPTRHVDAWPTPQHVS